MKYVDIGNFIIDINEIVRIKISPEGEAYLLYRTSGKTEILNVNLTKRLLEELTREGLPTQDILSYIDS